MISMIVMLFLTIIVLPGCFEVNISHKEGKRKKDKQGIELETDGGTVFLGTTDLHNKVFQDLNVTGKLDARSIKVKGTASLIGKSEIENSTFNILRVIGKAELEDVDVAKELNVVGYPELDGGKYNKIVITCEEFDFRNIEADSITIKKTTSDGIVQDQEGRLKNCRVRGDVVFESGKGSIRIDKKTKIGGEVKGVR